MRKNWFKAVTAAVCTVVLLITGQAIAQPPPVLGAGELEIALQKLTVLGSVLYLAAHPDDENTAVLAYVSKGKKYRTAYLSLTRGDGGQNLIGPEKGAEIGIIRTQELLGARRFDGAEQFFTRAIDFGYTKTPEETFEFWDREKVLSDVVRVIRMYRPDVIISRFSPDQSGGHGHHSASIILAKEAFIAAADPGRFPEQLRSVQPWQAARLLWNSFRPGQENIGALLKLDVGEYNPLLGKSYTEIAAESRSMHKTQGFGSAGRRGTRYEYFDRIDGTPAVSDMFEGIDTTWNRVPGGKKVGKMLDDILSSFDPRNPSKSIPDLLAVNDELGKLQGNPWVEIKRQELLRVIQSCAGLWMEAITDDFSASPGDEIQVRTTLINRSNHPFTLEKMSFPEAALDSVARRALDNNDPVTIETTITIPADIPISQPYWLRETPSIGMFSIADQNLIGLAENPPSIRAVITLESEGRLLEYTVPLVFRWTDRVDGELYRPFEIRPPITVTLEDKVAVFTDDSPKDIKVTVMSQSPHISGEISLKAPPEWKVNPSVIPFLSDGKYEEKQVVFTVSPPRLPAETELTAGAVVNGKPYSQSLVEISHPHIKRQVYFPVSLIKAVKVDLKKQGGTIGYIEGAGDEIPDCLRNLGYDIVFLDDEKLENADLSVFDAIITGIRAFNTREQLKHTQPKLLQYVTNGGTLIVQYNVPSGLITQDIGPYPLIIGQDRVSVETAPVIFLDPQHQLLNFPNRITRKDFEGWIQERGLYFATQWDEKYEPVLSSHDPNEPDRKGGLLFARYGKGVFIYTGYSWFRQLPAGVPGAYRFFVNLISAGKYSGK